MESLIVPLLHHPMMITAFFLIRYMNGKSGMTRLSFLPIMNRAMARTMKDDAVPASVRLCTEGRSGG
ncbi:MAG: hypothetical protein BAA03_07775 [Caldibacillus debilis]|nr:MAG: hypothetical protein BAA03_07775 [Caldibacillus debilis]